MLCVLIFIHDWRNLQFKDDSERQIFFFGHYNASIGIIDLLSHTIYVVCANFYIWLAEPAV